VVGVLIYPQQLVGWGLFGNLPDLDFPHRIKNVEIHGNVNTPSFKVCDGVFVIFGSWVLSKSVNILDF